MDEHGSSRSKPKRTDLHWVKTWMILLTAMESELLMSAEGRHGLRFLAIGAIKFSTAKAISLVVVLVGITSN
jgi:hypothetical protein